MTALQIRQFPCLTDNYGFLVHDPSSGETACVDTPDADAILREAETAGWRVTQIWNTHHHHDHAGGNAAVKAATGCRVVAPRAEADAIPSVDLHVGEGDQVALGAFRATIHETPGHTRGHIVYHLEEAGAAFVGDTLFALGCGRLFEGTPEQMWTSLSKILAWPDHTRLHCAHEYTQANARFALTIEPENQALQERARAIDAARARNEPTVPMTLAQEKASNPFVRPHSGAIRARLGLQNATDTEVFAEVRRRKDVF